MRATLFFLAAVALLVGCHRAAQRPASVLTDKDHAELASYEKIRYALAHDDQRSARVAASELADATKPSSPNDKPGAIFSGAQAVAQAPALDRARDSFKTLSAAVISRAGDVAGFYVMTCPMTPDGEWLQTDPNVDNPYMGSTMHDCGEVKH